MLSRLTSKLGETFARLRGRGRISEADLDSTLREVRLALLEADVNFRIVKEFIAEVRQQALGSNVLESLTPDQQIIAIVRDQMTALLGGHPQHVKAVSPPPTVVLVAGLQGTGKTTSCAKLAAELKRQGRQPLLVACDIYRPGAILQLQTVGAQVGVPVFEKGQQAPVQTARQALKHADEHRLDTVIVDTAGRLHVDEEMMAEVRAVHAAIKPHEVLLTVDAMTGQDAVNAAQAFHASIPLTGIILTKLDGDSRGGAVLSVRAVTGVPVKFVGVGEKLDALEPFYPDRMAGRILGMGDVLSLIERAEQQVDLKQAAAVEARLREGQFDLNDFLQQLQEVRKMGPLENVLGMIPGMSQLMAQQPAMAVEEKQLRQVEAIIRSMTPRERGDPEMLNGSRKRRIASGSGTSVQEVNRLLGQFRQMKQMMRQFTRLSGKQKMSKGFNPAGLMK